MISYCLEWAENKNFTFEYSITLNYSYSLYKSCLYYSLFFPYKYKIQCGSLLWSKEVYLVSESKRRIFFNNKITKIAWWSASYLEIKKKILVEIITLFSDIKNYYITLAHALSTKQMERVKFIRHYWFDFVTL